MGRGRAKAKQTKVARKLKYGGGHTDLDRLRQDLGVGESTAEDAPEDATRDDEGDDYAEYEADYAGYEAEYVPAERPARDRDEENGA